MKFLIVLLALSVVTAANAQKFVVAYVPNWINLDIFVPMIEWGKVTHVNIAFENPVDADGNMSWNPKNNIVIDRARANKVKVLLSIGGGGAADDKEMKPRYFDLIGEKKRAGFVAKLTDLVVKNKLDGLDVDIEGPSINEDYTAFVSELAKSLKAKKKLLTAAVSQGYGGDRVDKAALDCFDFVNLMAYDGTGNWSPDRPGQHSSFEFAKSTTAYWTAKGLPKSKVVLGVPFYGYGFGTAFRNYGYPYSEIVAGFPGSELLDQVGNTIWYNGIPTIKAKAKYILDEGLAGAMIWSLDQDVRGSKSLLGALAEGLKR